MVNHNDCKLVTQDASDFKQLQYGVVIGHHNHEFGNRRAEQLPILILIRIESFACRLVYI